MGQAIPHGSPVYIRYRDHVLYRNTPEALDQPAERETLGWLTQENRQLVCIQHDRTKENLPIAAGSASGLVLLKSCILEIRVLPLQKVSRWHLIPRSDTTSSAESALQNAERKIQPE